jgi:hypothetical protein
MARVDAHEQTEPQHTEETRPRGWIYRCWRWLFKCPEEDPKPTARFWRPFSWFFNSAMCAAIFGVIAVAVILAVFHSRTQPPGIDTVTNLMKAEITAGETHNTALVNRIYTRDAVVTDAACQTPGVSQSWQGYAQIDVRYRKLPKFLWLQHVFAQVTWDPNDSRASTAYVTADTAGVLLPVASHGKPQSIVGHELWMFVRVNGEWRIASFTYNLCLPVNPGA